MNLTTETNYITQARLPQCRDAAAADLVLWCRSYNPEVGQFVSMDPLEGNRTDPRHLNKYLYAGADPINNVDPSGLDFSLTGLGISMAIGATIGGTIGGIDAALGNESILGGILMGAGFGALFGAGGYLFPGFFASKWVFGAGIGFSIPGIIKSFRQGKNAQGYFRVFTGLAVPLAIRNFVISRLLAISKAAIAEWLSSLWNKVGLRINVYPNEPGITGAYVSQRIPLSPEVPPGRYLYVVDEAGEMWVAPQGAQAAGLEINHSSLVPAGARVRAAGHLLVTEDGSVNLNSRSGHFLAENPIRSAEEQSWFEAMVSTILSAGFAPGRISPGGSAVPP